MDKHIIEYLEKHREKRNQNLKYDFMPSLLEIIERPAHTAGTVIIWTIFLFLIAVIIWSYVSKVDVVVTASGKLEAVQEPDIIEAKGYYQIVSVKAKEGQQAKKGELLLELSAKEQEEELEDVEIQEKSIQGYIKLYESILQKKNVEKFELSSYKKTDQLEMEDIIENDKSNNKMMEQYNKGGFASQAEELNKEYKKEIEKALAQKQDELEKVNEKITQLKEQIDTTHIYAPYDCTINQVYVSKESISVSENQSLISLVNKEEDLEFECYVKNSDVADVKLNQEVKLKLDAYPHSNYGTIDGQVTFISQKVIESDEMAGMIMIKVAITDEDFDKNLYIGMTGTADLVIDKRRIINYFLDPITGALKDSLKEK